jgi:hypothetical protein
MHTVLPQTLLDRLVLHHQIGVVATPEHEGHTVIGPDETQSLDHMFYTSAVVAVYQLMQVRNPLISTKPWNLKAHLLCSAWTSYMPSRANCVGRCRSAASRDGTSCTSQGGELP